MDSTLKVLAILKNSKNKFVSGENIAKELKVSRVAVYKIIKKLIQEGYKIEKHKKLGYKLIGSPFSPEDLLKKTKFLKEVVFLKKTTSTMELAKDILAKNPYSEQVLIIAEEQTSGKGRIERKWFSPKGGLYFSLIVKPNVLPYEVFMLNYVFSLSVAETIKDLYNVRVFTKWPNDVVDAYHRKICGILLEIDSEIDKVNYCIVGVGINVNINSKFFSKHKLKAISLSQIVGKNLDMTEFTVELFKRIEKNYKLFEEKKFDILTSRWVSHSSTIGRTIKVQTFTQTIKGTAVGISSKTGALIIKTPYGLKEVLSGDCIHLR